jgi:hypothetical protein
MGKLVKAKDSADTPTIAQRILGMDPDALAVQEVENIEALREFNKDHLGKLYSYQILV